MRDFLDFLIEEKIKNKNAKVKILAIQGSARNENCCPDRESKSYKLLKNAIKDRRGVRRRSNFRIWNRLSNKRRQIRAGTIRKIQKSS